MRRQIPQPIFLLGLPLLLAIVSLGCGLTDSLRGAVSSNDESELPTRTPMPTFTSTPQSASFIEVDIAAQQTEAAVQTQATQQAQLPTAAPTEPLPSPSPTLPPEDTATPTPIGPPVVTILQNMNVRAGPGTNYPIVGAGPAGETSNVVGRNADGSWVQVEYPLTDDGKGWLYAGLVQIDGDVDSVDVVQVAPPPVVQAPPEPPQEEAPPPPPPEPQHQFTPTGWHASENAAIVHFKGRIKDEGGNLVNGFSVLADNGAFRVLSHPTGASPWYPDKGDGEWDIVMPNIYTAQGWWWLTVVKYECNFWGGFDSQCNDYTKLSEDVKIEVRTHDESIINADWICHWDCNTGIYVDSYRR